MYTAYETPPLDNSISIVYLEPEGNYIMYFIKHRGNTLLVLSRQYMHRERRHNIHTCTCINIKFTKDTGILHVDNQSFFVLDVLLIHVCLCNISNTVYMLGYGVLTDDYGCH